MANKNINPVQINETATTEEMVTVSFTFPKRLLGVSNCQNYFQLPYSVDGTMAGHTTNGSVTPAILAKGRVTVPTSTGRASWAKKNGKQEAKSIDYTKFA
tara:strand:- start:97 stop:396 length:300 start_codon:yes stop_codon:yes gene_type:complete